MDSEYDVVIVGAGISGISGAYYMKKICPKLRFLVIERRENIGGTWDLFKYPGIRSDSSMWTFGFSWKPWTLGKNLGSAPEILQYLNEAVDENDLRKHIRLKTNLISASYSSKTATWTLTTGQPPGTSHAKILCKFLFMTTGYYNYDKPYTPDIPGKHRFRGQLVHPQMWSGDMADYMGKNVVVIGSGATAATIIPEMAPHTKKITMLQRSPGYFVAGYFHTYTHILSLTGMCTVILPTCICRILSLTRILCLYVLRGAV
eukprot:m.349486 g.349486  ORF g.349486 m.349486 type:complete len:260 (-) comp20689_c1_seq1:1887-2666(-)